MKRLLMTAVTLLSVAGCGDANPNPLSAGGTGPDLSTGPAGPTYTSFTTQQPASYISASPGWEVGTRFKVSEPGRIVGFRFFRAPGESGTNRARLWLNGTQVRSVSFPNSARPGWDTARVSATNHLRIQANTYYRVSVNTNSYQAKTFRDTPYSLINGPLTADMSYYGQPTGSMPTNGSYSWFFVDVIFVPDGPLPNLYVASITPSADHESVTIRICNNGQAAASASQTRVEHWAGMFYDPFDPVSTPSLAAGACVNLLAATSSGNPGDTHAYYVTADYGDAVYESNEGDNQGALE